MIFTYFPIKHIFDRPYQNTSIKMMSKYQGQNSPKTNSSYFVMILKQTKKYNFVGNELHEYMLNTGS